jgi:hypothetical protein
MLGGQPLKTARWDLCRGYWVTGGPTAMALASAFDRTNQRRTHQTMKRLDRFIAFDARFFAFAAVLVLLASSVMAVVATPANDAGIEPMDFTTNIDNPFFPLQAGTTFIYSGFKDQSALRDEFAVTHDTARIDHVTCVEET